MKTPQISFAYREAAIRGASNVELVIMMYNWIVQDLRRAKEAQKAGNIEARTTEVKHCLSVLEQLQTNLDHSNGGDAAVNMDRLYSIARAKLVEASIKGSAGIFDHLITIFVDLLGAWTQLEPKVVPAEIPFSEMAPSHQLTNCAGSVEREWVI